MAAVPLMSLLALSSAASAPASTTAAAAVQPAPSGQVSVRLLDLATVRRMLNAIARQAPVMSEGERIAAWADFSLMTEAVTGNPKGNPLTFEELMADSARGRSPEVVAAAGVASRDAAAYQLLALGYSPREAADVVGGRISQHALDTARQMLAIGLSQDAAASYLDGQYKQVIAMRNARRAPPSGRMGALASAFDPLIEKYARLHQVEAAVIRAIMATESAFNPAARSPKGAIGLMQLMPGTARELGVNPFVPEQNIEGGVRYFAQLLRMFGGLELALVAYNGGPGYAQRYARGQAALYGETRDYVRKVLGRMGR